MSNDQLSALICEYIFTEDLDMHYHKIYNSTMDGYASK